MMTNNVKARKMLSKGYITYLVHIMSILDKVVPGVKDYSNSARIPIYFP